MTNNNILAGAARGVVKKLLVAGTGVIVAGMIAGTAQAAVIDLNPTQALFGPSYSQDGFTVTNSNGTADAYLNHILRGFPQFNANNDNATITQNHSGTTNTLTQDSGAPFTFESIGLGDVSNFLRKTLTVAFTFNYVGGGAWSETVTLQDPGVLNMQYFHFDQSNLASVVFTPVSLGPSGSFVQFDFLGVNGAATAVPEPSSWALMMLGLCAMGGVVAMRRRPTNTDAAIA